MESETGKFKDFILKIIEHYSMYEESFPPFIACFGEEKDDLFQWRYYANDGKGFMIGFKTKYLQVHSIWDYILSKPDANSPKLDDFFIGNVIYEPLEQEYFINQMFDMSKVAFKLMREEQINFFARKLYMISSLYKNHHYKNEKEWRLIQYPIIQPNSRRNENFSYRATSNAIIPYNQLVLEQDETNKDLPIGSVLIGPCNKSSKKEIDNFGNFYYAYWRFNSTQYSEINYLGK